jgi:hypothetical protein
MLLVLFFAIVILLVILPSPTPRLGILVTEAAFTTTPPRCFHKVTRHLFEKLKTNNKQGNEEDINDAPPTTVKKTNQENNRLLSNALSAVQKFAQQSSSKVVTSVSGVQSVATSASSRVVSTISDMAMQGSGDVISAASTLGGLAQKGTLKVKSTATAATTTIRQVAQKGTTDVKSITGAAALSLTQLAGKGTEDAIKTLEWMDSKAKDGASVANARAKDLVLAFTGKSEYEFGDVTKELVRRTLTAEYSLQDMLLLLRVLLAVGASCTPLAKVLPLTMLLEMLNVSLEARLGGKILEVVAGAVDERVRAAFTAEELGDLVKKTATGAILSFTGKETFKSGDIQRAAVAQQQQQHQKEANLQGPSNNGNDGSNQTTPSPPPLPPKTLQLVIGPELEDWDQAFRQIHPDTELAEIFGSLNGFRDLKTLDAQIACELEEWDKMFLEKYPDSKL